MGAVASENKFDVSQAEMVMDQEMFEVFSLIMFDHVCDVCPDSLPEVIATGSQVKSPVTWNTMRFISGFEEWCKHFG